VARSSTGRGRALKRWRVALVIVSVLVGGACLAIWLRRHSGRPPSLDRRQLQAEVATAPAETRPIPQALAAPAETTAAPRLDLTVARYKPRPPGEWDGMLVDLSRQPYCSDTAHCSLARACKSGHCAACETDTDCMANERCVLDHCVLDDKVRCRRKVDCGANGMCLLTGYSRGLRSNEDMEAACVEIVGGDKLRPPAPPAPPDTRDAPLPLDEERTRARALQEH
jgi:hypothetical protein